MLGLALLTAAAPGATNFISGDVASSATWSGTNLLSGTVTIRSNVVVTISPGTRLLMNTAAVLRVEGQLLANGASNQPITFTRATTTTNWGRIIFVKAAPSRLGHCVIEFANSAGDHQNYYTNSVLCDPTSPPIPRTYREAVVALATHLDIDNCIFQNLPYNTGSRDGDAIAIISDDVQFPGPASAHIWNSRFMSIGQGIHSRYSPLLVEYCTFSDKRGDNDDIDMYGESTPPPVIRYNTFLAGHEDKINPTRCSAIIYGNFISGGDDHGVVLRDKCNPVVFNNIISNFTAAAISVQNQCDALIANNTIVNSGRGVRMFDHTARHGPPYCLFPGNGRATIVNCIIWNTPSGAVTMEASSFQPHPVVTVISSDLQHGIVTNNANCVINWGFGNISLDPLFTAGVRLRTNSPCIDAGTNALLLMSSNWTASITNDYDGLPRPLDGNGDGLARFDIGAYEFMLASADSNNDGIPDGWAHRYGLNPTDPTVAADNPDDDPHTTLEEWIADTDPTNALSYFKIETISNLPPIVVSFLSSSNRLYSLFSSTNLSDASGFSSVPNRADVPGTGGMQTLTDTNSAPTSFYRVNVKLP
jgi:hypothetical protein